MTTPAKTIALPPPGLPAGTIAITVQAPPDEPGFAIESATDVIALAGLVMAIVSAIIAWWAFLRSKAESRLAHVNGLFREMLSMEYDFQKTGFDDPDQRKQAYLRLMSHKMWVLEELWLWLQEYKPKWWFSADGEYRRNKEVKGWEATIANHIHRREEWHFGNFDDAKKKGVYETRFVEFVERERGKARDVKARVGQSAKGQAASDP